MLNVTNGKYVIEPLKDKDAYSTLNKGCSLLGGLKCVYWLSYGTALGLHRDGAFMPHDTDIDVTTVGNHKIAEIRELFKFNGFDEVRTSVDSDSGFIYQIVFVDTKSNVLFDIDFLDARGHLLCTESEANGKVEFPIEFLSEIIHIPFNYNCYPFINPDKYVEYVYGKDWRTPIAKQSTKYCWGKDDN